MKRLLSLSVTLLLCAALSAQSFRLLPGWSPDAGLRPAAGVGYFEQPLRGGEPTQGFFLVYAHPGFHVSGGVNLSGRPESLLLGPTFAGVLGLESATLAFPVSPLVGVSHLSAEGRFDYGVSFGVLWNGPFRPGLLVRISRDTAGCAFTLSF